MGERVARARSRCIRRFTWLHYALPCLYPSRRRIPLYHRPLRLPGDDRQAESLGRHAPSRDSPLRRQTPRRERPIAHPRRGVACSLRALITVATRARRRVRRRAAPWTRIVGAGGQPQAENGEHRDQQSKTRHVAVNVTHSQTSFLLGESTEGGNALYAAALALSPLRAGGTHQSTVMVNAYWFPSVSTTWMVYEAGKSSLHPVLTTSVLCPPGGVCVTAEGQLTVGPPSILN